MSIRFRYQKNPDRTELTFELPPNTFDRTQPKRLVRFFPASQKPQAKTKLKPHARPLHKMETMTMKSEGSIRIEEKGGFNYFRDGPNLSSFNYIRVGVDREPIVRRAPNKRRTKKNTNERRK